MGIKTSGFYVICDPWGDGMAAPEKAMKHKGFTLIELMIVIFIFAILITLIVSAGRYAVNEGNRTKTVAIQHILLTGPIAAFFELYQKYPDDRKINNNTAWEGYPANDLPLQAGDPQLGSPYNNISGSILATYLTGSFSASNQECINYIKGRPTGTAVTAQEITDESARIQTYVTPKLAMLPDGAYSTLYSGAGFFGQPAGYFVDGYGHQLMWYIGMAWQQIMQYTRCDGKGGGPALISCGPDGVFGTPDDIRSDGTHSP
jgi:prepilin-type N-terminal cleavage/methylation domain-containing protein